MYSFQLNTSANYKVKKWNTAFTVLFKHNGNQQNYISSGIDDNGNAIFSKSTTSAYNWVDASIKKSFFKNQIQATLGGRNLFDVTNVNVSNASTNGVAHASNNNSLLLGYGRSYYLKLLYNLNF